MPLFHMSFIIQCLVRSENVLTGVKKNEHIMHIGSRAENLKICLEHKNRHYMGADCCYRQYISLCEYRSVVIRDNILAVLKAEQARDIDVIMLETEPVRHGYVQLQTLCPQLHRGRTYWADETTALLKHTQQKQTHKVHNIVHQGIMYLAWPEAAAEWLSRDRPSGWPGQKIIDSIRESGCLVISRAHPRSLQQEVEWQIIFPHAESLLVTEALTQSQQYCLHVFKILVDFHLRDLSIRLKTTTFKTIFYFACEVLPMDAWEQNIGGCLMYLLDKLYIHLSKKWLPNYFIQSNNMYDHFSEYEAHAESIYILRSFPIMGLFFLVDHHELMEIPILDDAMDEIKVYLTHHDAHQSYHATLLPIWLKLARFNMMNERYSHASSILHSAYQEILTVAKEHEDIPTFEEFLRKVLATEDAVDRRCMFRFLNRHYGTKLQQRVGSEAAQMTTFKEIEGIGDLEQFCDEPIPKNYLGDTVMELIHIMPVVKRLEKEKKYSDGVCLMQRVIEKAKRFIEGCVAPDIIDDPALERDLIRQSEIPKTLMSTLLMVTYKSLFKCLSSLHEEDKFRPYIQDYENVCLQLNYTEFIPNVADIWQRLGYNEKAKTLREEAKRCRNEKAKDMAETVMSILSDSSVSNILRLMRT